MVATISMEYSNWEESISTCSFAQRVALIKNTISVNTQVDDKVLIRQLRQEKKQIKEELDMIKQEKEMLVELTQDHFGKCLEALRACLGNDQQLVEMAKSVELGEKWTRYEHPIVSEVAYQPLMALTCFNLFVRVIRDKDKLIREGMAGTRKQSQSECPEESNLHRETSSTKSESTRKKEHSQKEREQGTIEDKREDEDQNNLKHFDRNKENKKKQSNQMTKKIKIKPQIEEKELEQLEISENIKNNKESCLEIFKKSPKFVRRFEGLEQDKALLREKIERGKCGSDVNRFWSSAHSLL